MATLAVLNAGIAASQRQLQFHQPGTDLYERRLAELRGFEQQRAALLGAAAAKGFTETQVAGSSVMEVLQQPPLPAPDASDFEAPGQYGGVDAVVGAGGAGVPGAGGGAPGASSFAGLALVGGAILLFAILVKR